MNLGGYHQRRVLELSFFFRDSEDFLNGNMIKCSSNYNLSAVMVEIEAGGYASVLSKLQNDILK